MDTILSKRIDLPPDAAVFPTFETTSYVEWPTIFAGAVVALALSFVLLSFGSAAGLSALSPWTSTRASVTAVSLGAAFWLILVNIWSFGLGGYLAARMRHRSRGAVALEVEFRDGAHGAIVWGLAVTIAAVVAALVATSIARGGLDLAAGGQTAGGPTNDATTYATDTLLRTSRPAPDSRSDDARLEIGRFLVRQAGRSEMAATDKTHLTQLVAARTGLTPGDAEKRVDETVAQIKAASNRARKTAVVLGFMTAATLLLGAVAAWWGATVGGKHRDEGTVWQGLGGPMSFSSFWSK
jgi:hypothetical protein